MSRNAKGLLNFMDGMVWGEQDAKRAIAWWRSAGPVLDKPITDGQLANIYRAAWNDCLARLSKEGIVERYDAPADQAATGVKQEAARHEAWSLYAKAYDQAEYLRTVEHRAIGEQEATSRFHDRIATAAIKRDEQIAATGVVAVNARKAIGV